MRVVRRNQLWHKPIAQWTHVFCFCFSKSFYRQVSEECVRWPHQTCHGTHELWSDQDQKESAGPWGHKDEPEQAKLRKARTKQAVLENHPHFKYLWFLWLVQPKRTSTNAQHATTRPTLWRNRKQISWKFRQAWLSLICPRCYHTFCAPRLRHTCIVIGYEAGAKTVPVGRNNKLWSKTNISVKPD